MTHNKILCGKTFARSTGSEVHHNLSCDVSSISATSGARAATFPTREGWDCGITAVSGYRLNKNKPAQNKNQVGRSGGERGSEQEPTLRDILEGSMTWGGQIHPVST